MSVATPTRHVRCAKRCDWQRRRTPARHRAWLWVEAYCLDALCTLAHEHGRPEAARWIGDLEALAARTGMREMVARAYLHRGRLPAPASEAGPRPPGAICAGPASRCRETPMTSPPPILGSFVERLAARDFGGLGACLGPDVRLRATIPA